MPTTRMRIVRVPLGTAMLLATAGCDSLSGAFEPGLAKGQFEVQVTNYTDVPLAGALVFPTSWNLACPAVDTSRVRPRWIPMSLAGSGTSASIASPEGCYGVYGRFQSRAGFGYTQFWVSAGTQQSPYSSVAFTATPGANPAASTNTSGRLTLRNDVAGHSQAITRIITEPCAGAQAGSAGRATDTQVSIPWGEERTYILPAACHRVFLIFSGNGAYVTEAEMTDAQPSVAIRPAP